MRKSLVGIVVLFSILNAIDAAPQGNSENVCVSVVLTVQTTAVVGENVPITLTVTNCGPRNGRFYSYIYAIPPCGSLISYSSVPRIESGQTVTLSTTYVPTCVGEHAIAGTASGNHGNPSSAQTILTVN